MSELGASPDRSLCAAIVAVADGLELNATLHRIITAAVDLSDATYGALGVVDEDGNLRDFLHVGMTTETVAAIGDSPKGIGVLGLLIDQPMPRLINDIAAHPASAGFPPGHPQMHSFLGIPLRVRGQVFGNLYLTEKRNGEPFSDADEQLVVALAAAAAVAIDNARLFEETRLRGRWHEALRVVDAASLADKSIDEVMQAAMVAAREVTGADVGLIVSDGAQSVKLPVECTHVVRLSIGEADRAYGNIMLGWTNQNSPLSAEAKAVAEEFSAQVGIIVSLAHARAESQRLVVFEDRDRIARDLHDLVIQRLFAAGMMLQSTGHIDGVPTAVAHRVTRVVDELDATIREIRNTIFALHESMELSSSSLRGLVLAEISQSSGALGFTPSIRFTGPVDSVTTQSLTDNVLAVLREALSNAARHAAATEIEVLLATADGKLSLVVTDNGIGFSDTDRRSGLANAASRSTSLGGVCRVERVSDAGGTVLHWSVPL